MTWFAANWFSVLIFIAFVGMHFFMHGGHGGGRRAPDRHDADGAEGRGDPPVGGHQH